MSEFHITRKMRWARERGQLPDEVYYRLLEEHHLATCATCRREKEAHEQRHDYSAAFAAAQQAQEGQIERVAEELREAEEDLARLLELPSEERIPTVRRSRRRFRSPVLGRKLLDRSFSHLPHDPAAAPERWPCWPWPTGETPCGRWAGFPKPGRASRAAESSSATV